MSGVCRVEPSLLVPNLAFEVGEDDQQKEHAPNGEQSQKGVVDQQPQPQRRLVRLVVEAGRDPIQDSVAEDPVREYSQNGNDHSQRCTVVSLAARGSSEPCREVPGRRARRSSNRPSPGVRRGHDSEPRGRTLRHPRAGSDGAAHSRSRSRVRAFPSPTGRIEARFSSRNHLPLPSSRVERRSAPGTDALPLRPFGRNPTRQNSTLLPGRLQECAGGQPFE